MRKYLLRLDDACPYMDRVKWKRMEDMLDKYSIKPLVGIIPANADPKTMIEPEDPKFWDKAHLWEKKGWRVALHGYDHVCISEGGMKGLNPFWKRSEFSGLPLEQQRKKIRQGYDVLKEKGFSPVFFFSPSHTFDKNTVQAIKEETPIRIISDMVALKPYWFGDFLVIPQFSGHCVGMKLEGIYTFCFHPNSMTDRQFLELEKFLKNNQKHFIEFGDIVSRKWDSIRLSDKLFRWLFFSYRRLKKLQ